MVSKKQGKTRAEWPELDVMLSSGELWEQIIFFAETNFEELTTNNQSALVIRSQYYRYMGLLSDL